MFLFSIQSDPCFWEQPTFFQFLNQCSQESCLKVWSQDHQHQLGPGACQKCSISNPIPDLMNQWVNEWVLVTQLCLTLCCPMNCNPPGSSTHGILQARILEWVAISFFRESSRSRDQTQVSRIADRFFTVWATREALNKWSTCLISMCACMLSRFSGVWLFVTLWRVAHQAPLSMGFSRQEYWSGLPRPPPGDLPDPGIKLLIKHIHTLRVWRVYALEKTLVLGKIEGKRRKGSRRWDG